MAEFQVGPGILEKMQELGDTPVAHSVFWHPWPGGTIEQGFGSIWTYFADDLDQGTWRTIIRANHVAPAPTILQAIDVSSHQSRNLSQYVQLAGAEYVIVRMYMETVEGPSPQHSVAQVESARALGCGVGAYGWPYSGVDARLQVGEQLDTCGLAGVTPTVLWQDIEHYRNPNTGAVSLPTVQEIDRVLGECARAGVEGGFYSSKSIWDELGNPEFPGTPFWIADWDGIPELPNPPDDVFAGMVIVAKQFTSIAPDGSPLDRNVIRSEFA